ncbi:hypothetical protein pb186bvf_014864 [Paramecium bursaria]
MTKQDLQNNQNTFTIKQKILYPKKYIIQFIILMRQWKISNQVICVQLFFIILCLIVFLGIYSMSVYYVITTLETISTGILVEKQFPKYYGMFNKNVYQKMKEIQVVGYRNAYIISQLQSQIQTRQMQIDNKPYFCNQTFAILDNNNYCVFISNNQNINSLESQTLKQFTNFMMQFVFMLPYRKQLITTQNNSMLVSRKINKLQYDKIFQQIIDSIKNTNTSQLITSAFNSSDVTLMQLTYQKISKNVTDIFGNQVNTNEYLQTYNAGELHIINDQGLIIYSQIYITNSSYNFSQQQFFYNTNITGFDKEDFQIILNASKYQQYVDWCERKMNLKNTICLQDVNNKEWQLVIFPIIMNKYILLAKIDQQMFQNSLGTNIEEIENYQRNLLYVIINQIAFIFVVSLLICYVSMKYLQKKLKSLISMVHKEISFKGYKNVQIQIWHNQIFDKNNSKDLISKLNQSFIKLITLSKSANYAESYSYIDFPQDDREISTYYIYKAIGHIK